MVTAPRPQVAEMAATAPGHASTSGWSAAQLADALNPARASAPTGEPITPPGAQQELFTAKATAATTQPEREKKRHVLDSILDEPGKLQRPPAAQAQAPIEDEVREPQPRVRVRTPSALEPRTVFDSREREAAEMPGMGEMLAGGKAAAAEHEHEHELGSKSVLHVPFLPVNDGREEARQARWRRLTIIGVVAFVVLDVAVALWLFRKPLQERFGGASTDDAAATSHSPRTPSKVSGLGQARTGPVGTPEAEVTKPSAPVTPEAPVTSPAVARPGQEGSAPPLATLPEGVLSPSMKSAAPNSSAVVPSTTAPPSDPPGAAQALSAVPLAIPLPGAVGAANVPTAIPVVPSSTNAEPVAMVPAPIIPPAPPEAPKVENPTTLPAGAAVPPPPPLPASANEPSTPLGTGAMQSASLALEPLPPVPATPTEPRIGKLPVEAKGALQTLRTFLDAPTWEQRAAVSLKGEALKGAMEKHAAMFGDGPTRVEAISFVQRYPSKNGVPPYCMFEVSGGALRLPVMVLVEESPKSGIRVDWEAFVDFKDGLLLRFLSDHSLPAQKFRVMLQRHHYFEDDVPDVDGKDSFKAIQPNTDFIANVFLPKGSPVARQLSSKLTWGEDIPVIAELVWRTDGKLHWVEIASIVSYGWRG